MFALNTILWCFTACTLFKESTAQPSGFAMVSGPDGVYVTTAASQNGPGSVSISTDDAHKASPDEKDAVTIINANQDEAIIAGILPFRTLDHRKQIDVNVGSMNGGKNLIPEGYEPNDEENTPFKDLCYVLVSDPTTVLSMYLGKFLHRKDQPYITIVLTLVQRMQEFKTTYNSQHLNSIGYRCRKQKSPYSNMMRVWIEQDRDGEKNCNLDRQQITQDAESLKTESDKWDDDRNQLEVILMRKCIPYALEVIKEFEKTKGNILEVIPKNIDNHNLADAYSSLASYIKDKYKYMSGILLNHSDGKDRWAVWLILIGITTPEEWSKIDAAFKKDNKDASLVDFLLKSTEQDRVFIEMMAVMIHPSYEPKTFKKV